MRLPSLLSLSKQTPLAKILKIVSALLVMIAFILTTVIVTAGKNESSKHLYLVSFEYDNNNENITKAAGEVSSLIGKFRGDSKDRSFSEVRVGYSGICTHVEFEGRDKWECGNLDAAALLGKNTSGDPFELISVATYYKEHVAFSIPWWASSGLLGIGMLLLFFNCIPFISLPLIVSKIATATLFLGTFSLLGGLIIMKFTTDAVSNIADRLTLGTVTAHAGTANQAFGWTAFALALLSTIAITLITIAESVLTCADTKISTKANQALGLGRSLSGQSSTTGLATSSSSFGRSASSSYGGRAQMLERVAGAGMNYLKEKNERKNEVTVPPHAHTPYPTTMPGHSNMV